MGLGIISPTGQEPRGYDRWGSGRFAASRGTRLHLGCDYVCAPGQEVIAPLGGIVRRESRPYTASILSGIIVDTLWSWYRLFYFKPYTHLLKPATIITIGQVLGTAQNCTTEGPKKYPEMTPHIHMEMWFRVGPNSRMLYNTLDRFDIAVDPELFREAQ